jgi:hypothetical protein
MTTVENVIALLGEGKSCAKLQRIRQIGVSLW